MSSSPARRFRGYLPRLCHLMTRAGIEPALSQEKIAAVTQYMSATKITIGSSRVV